MTLDADLYFTSIDLSRYLGGESCGLCRVESVEELADRIRSGRLKDGVCPHWPPSRLKAFRLAMETGGSLPRVPCLETPRPAPVGLIELNSADASSPLLVTGNSELTQAVVLAVLSLARGPLRLLCVDTLGHTVDMAMIFKTLTADKLARALREVGNLGAPAAPRIVLPGLAGILGPELERELGRKIEVGPVCAAELPLYLQQDWK